MVSAPALDLTTLFEVIYDFGVGAAPTPVPKRRGGVVSPIFAPLPPKSSTQLGGLRGKNGEIYWGSILSPK